MEETRNKISEAKIVNGFFVQSVDYDLFKGSLDKALYAYIDNDGRHMRPHIITSIDNNEYEEGIIIDVNRYGVIIKGEYTTRTENTCEIKKTRNINSLLTSWIIKRNQEWVLFEGSRLLLIEHI